jgi:uncharacterized repeat protein (TIGR01451 family)
MMNTDNEARPPEAHRRAGGRRRALLVAGTAATVFVAGTVLAPAAFAKGGNGKPPGNNGTVKIEGIPLDSGPGSGGKDNDPHVKCHFQLQFFGYDPGTDYARVAFTAQPPGGHGGAVLPSPLEPADTVPAASGTNQTYLLFTGSGPGKSLDRVENYTLNTQGLVAQKKQGYHIKVTTLVGATTGPDSRSKSADVKHKVFWLAPCVPTSTSQTLEVNKTFITPVHSTDAVNLIVDGVAYAVATTANTGTTGAVHVPAGTNTVAETAANGGTLLTNYTAVLSCPLATSVTAIGTAAKPKWTVVVPAGKAVVCSLTNTGAVVTPPAQTLEVNKTFINPVHSADAVDLLVNGVVEGVAGTGNHGTTGPVSVPAGANRVAEKAANNGTILTDYAATLSCPLATSVTSIGTAAAPKWTVVVPAATAVVCTLTNTAAVIPPALTYGLFVHKTVTDLRSGAHGTAITAKVGDTLVYHVRVTATGTGTETGVVVTDRLPAAVHYVSCGGAPCSEAAGLVTWHVGTMAAGTHRALTVTVTVRPLPKGVTSETFPNVAVASSAKITKVRSNVVTVHVAVAGVPSIVTGVHHHKAVTVTPVSVSVPTKVAGLTATKLPFTGAPDVPLLLAVALLLIGAGALTLRVRPAGASAPAEGGHSAPTPRVGTRRVGIPWVATPGTGTLRVGLARPAWYAWPGQPSAAGWTAPTISTTVRWLRLFRRRD